MAYRMRIAQSPLARARQGVIAGLILGFSLVMPARGASITVNAPDAYGRIFVDVVGEIVAGDEKAFEQRVAILRTHNDKVIVSLSGPGGVALPAIRIGELVHEYGWATHVSSGNPCTSSCSIIWLAGTPRTIDGAPAVIIGFHAIYNKDTERESGAANAVLGHYLTLWGLNEMGVACVTISPPKEMGWLTGPAGKECGITWEVLTPARDVPLVLPSGPTPTQAQRAPLPQEAEHTGPEPKRRFRVVSDDGFLNIRKGPGPEYDVITTMPSGETGTAGRCLSVQSNSSYLPFCEVEWRGITGWASSCCIPDAEQATSTQLIKGLRLFCTNRSDQTQNPQGDGVFVQMTEGGAGWRMHVVHKTSGQLHDRNQQYDVFAFRRDENGIRGYYWDGVLIKDQNVLMTGHLWLNAGVWLYNEFISFRDHSQPVKAATPSIMCQPTG
jgi:hypothetical protein